MTTTNPIEVRDMAIIHQTFRRAYQESAALVRATPTPSSARVAFLADHIDFGLTMLHHHHEGEDEILYPLLEARSLARVLVIGTSLGALMGMVMAAVRPAAVAVTQKEWNSLGKHGVASIPASKRMIAFGMILEPLNDADRAYMLTVLPPPIRLLYRLSGKNAWTKYAKTLREGT